MPALRARGGIVEIGVDRPRDGPGRRPGRCSRAPVSCSSPIQTSTSSSAHRGWPVGLYLAALAMNAGLALDAASRSRGTIASSADYLRSEFLHRVSRADVSFLDPHVDPRAPVWAAVRRSPVAPDRVTCSIDWSAATSWCCRSIDAGRGTAITTSSATCCTPSCHGASRTSSPSCTPVPRRGTRPTTCPRQHRARPALRRRRPGRSSGAQGRQPGVGQRAPDTVLRWMEWFSDNGLCREPARRSRCTAP